MILTPRANEYKAVVELMESDEFETAEAMAKAIVKTVFAEFLKRDWYVHAFRFTSGLVLPWGPFSSDKEVEKYAKRFGIGDEHGQHRSIKVFSPLRQDEIDKEMKAAGEPVICDNCGHPKGLHEHDKAGGRCVARGCRCAKLIRKVESE